jgi:Na+-driven multidrug efflux pump
LAEAVTAGLMLYYLLRRQPELSLRGTSGRFIPTRPIITKATVIALPMTIEHAVICGAQIAVTTIVAPLGVFAIAANSFAVTAESLCYMPGYGISEAATTLIGQSYGAKRYELMKKFGFITVGMGMVIMSVMGVLMYIFSPYVMALMSPVSEIQSLGTEILRIEAWAEPMFAASIVAYGVFVGVGQTVVPAIMNFSSIWLVRLPLAWLLARPLGIKGVWIAMCIELIFRGSIFLYKLLFTRWHTPTPSRR